MNHVPSGHPTPAARQARRARSGAPTALVVGAGVFGLCVARELADRGWSVDAVDRHEPGATGPSSAESRILRCAHGEDEWYARSAAEARRLWRRLAAETGQELFLESGVLHFASAGADHGWELAALAAMERHGIPAEYVPGAEVPRRFPGFAAEGLDFAVHEPQGGILLARRAMLALTGSAIRRGVRIARGEAAPAGSGGALVDGVPRSPDLVVWAVGPALPALFPGVTSVTEERQNGYYLRADGSWAAGGRHPEGRTASPAWIDRAAECYGVPALGRSGAKIVLDEGVAPDRPGAPRLPRRLRGYLRSRLPELAGAPLIGREECSYAWSPDGHFLLDRLPGSLSSWLVGGDSGHGFKHGPAWGRYVCDVIEGEEEPAPSFRLR